MTERFTNITITHNNGDTFYAMWDTHTQRIIGPRVLKVHRDYYDYDHHDRAWFQVQEAVIQANTVERNKAHAAAWSAAVMSPGFIEFARSIYGTRFNIEDAVWLVQETLLSRWNEYLEESSPI